MAADRACVLGIGRVCGGRDGAELVDADVLTDQGSRRLARRWDLKRRRGKPRDRLFDLRAPFLKAGGDLDTGASRRPTGMLSGRADHRIQQVPEGPGS
jgi:hypothetical protein